MKCGDTTHFYGPIENGSFLFYSVRYSLCYFLAIMLAMLFTVPVVIPSVIVIAITTRKPFLYVGPVMGVQDPSQSYGALSFEPLCFHRAFLKRNQIPTRTGNDMFIVVDWLSTFLRAALHNFCNGSRHVFLVKSSLNLHILKVTSRGNYSFSCQL